MSSRMKSTNTRYKKTKKGHKLTIASEGHGKSKLEFLRRALGSIVQMLKEFE